MGFLWPHNSGLCLSFHGPRLLVHFHCFANAPPDGFTHIREEPQDAPKASNLRKPELCCFCTETDRMDRSLSVHLRSLGSKEAIPERGRPTRSSLLSLRNLMSPQSLLLCAIPSHKEKETQFIGIPPPSFLLYFPSPYLGSSSSERYSPGDKTKTASHTNGEKLVCRPACMHACM